MEKSAYTSPILSTIPNRQTDNLKNEELQQIIKWWTEWEKKWTNCIENPVRLTLVN